MFRIQRYEKCGKYFLQTDGSEEKRDEARFGGAIIQTISRESFFEISVRSWFRTEIWWVRVACSSSGSDWSASFARSPAMMSSITFDLYRITARGTATGSRSCSLSTTMSNFFHSLLTM